MSINYDCVAIWVDTCKRDFLLEIFEEDYGVKLAGRTQGYRRATVLFYYKEQPTRLFWSDNEHTFKEACEYVEQKKYDGKIGSYLMINYPKLVKECREWTYDY
jgi:hypothetical protein